MAEGQYTRPERAAEIALSRRIVARVTAAGGCAYCINAVHGWGRSACDAPGRVFPRCLHTPGKQFEPDHNKLQGDQ